MVELRKLYTPIKKEKKTQLWYSRSSVVLPENNSRVWEERTNSHICRDRESLTWFQADQMRAEINKMATRLVVYSCDSSGYPCSRYDLCQCQSSATGRTSWGFDPAWIQLSSEDTHTHTHTHTHTMLDITEQNCMYLLSNVYTAIYIPMYLDIMKSDCTIKWTIFLFLYLYQCSTWDGVGEMPSLLPL